MAVPLTESKAVFLERCELAGLPSGSRDALVAKNLNTLASLAFAAGQPGETPTDAALTALVRTGADEVPIATLASLRRLVFEAQLLMTAQVKQLIEQRADDQKAELAPAERALAMDLVGVCSYHVIMDFHEYLMSVSALGQTGNFRWMSSFLFFKEILKWLFTFYLWELRAAPADPNEDKMMELVVIR
ncbi:unnamed protein product, partial [Symbiodinium necroappetens]